LHLLQFFKLILVSKLYHLSVLRWFYIFKNRCTLIINSSALFLI
jgi:hypothetical protein